jgi:hypothetical protein
MYEHYGVTRGDCFIVGPPPKQLIVILPELLDVRLPSLLIVADLFLYFCRNSVISGHLRNAVGSYLVIRRNDVRATCLHPPAKPKMAASSAVATVMTH